MAIDETAALKAASWALGQILGENFVAAGYDSPQQMVLAFVEGGESEHLAAMVRFIKANRLDDELRAHNWAGFARGYNGPAYAEHGYPSGKVGPCREQRDARRARSIECRWRGSRCETQP